MNKNNKKILINFLFLLIFILSISIIFVPKVRASGSFQYTPMESVPGLGGDSSFSGYIQAIYNFGIWAVGVSAMLMISIGGFMYLTSAGNTSKTGKAKEIITDAIIGIILAMVSWLLLYTINHDLVKNTTNISKPSSTVTP